MTVREKQRKRLTLRDRERAGQLETERGTMRDRER